ncbi:MAG: D-alanine--D-alanine ligase [Acidobacteria bacterium]|nr:D-alanine--D-alanine ligase [Acidobacteriota bacterium]
MRRRLRVGVLFGGRSVEHSVSLQSARYVVEGLRENRHEVIPIGITPEGRWIPLRSLPAPEVKLLPSEPTNGHLAPADEPARDLIGLDGPRGAKEGRPGRLDVVFPVLHGLHGEDGTIQGLLETADIPYVGSGVLGSALGMDKAVMKVLLRQAGLPVAEHLVLREPEWPAAAADLRGRVESEIGFPCFVKPANCGSSVGVTKVRSAAELGPAVETAFRYDRKVLVEAFVAGREIECSVLGNDDPTASVPGEILPGREFYDYRAKYLEDCARLLIPAPLAEEQARRVRDLSLRAFLALECSGMARVDFFLRRDTGEILINELNTIPGFTAISMYPKLWEASGMGRGELLDRLLALALERHRQRHGRETRYLPGRDG